MFIVTTQEKINHTSKVYLTFLEPFILPSVHRQVMAQLSQETISHLQELQELFLLEIKLRLRSHLHQELSPLLLTRLEAYHLFLKIIEKKKLGQVNKESKTCSKKEIQGKNLNQLSLTLRESMSSQGPNTIINYTCLPYLQIQLETFSNLKKLRIQETYSIMKL